MIPLIKSIPQKTVTINHKDYNLYDIIQVTQDSNINRGMWGISVSILGKRRHHTVKTDEAVQIAIDNCNRFVELFYEGDRYKPAKLNNAKVGRYINANTEYVRVFGTYKKLNAGGSYVRLSCYVGSATQITNHDIDSAIKEVNDFVNKHNETYNLWLETRHKRFRLAVDSEMLERDNMLKKKLRSDGSIARVAETLSRRKTKEPA